MGLPQEGGWGGLDRVRPEPTEKDKAIWRAIKANQNPRPFIPSQESDDVETCISQHFCGL